MQELAWWRIIAQGAVVLTGFVLCLIRPYPFLRMVMLCVGAMILYGWIQDQFSVRICAEYFTIGHPTIQGLTDPTFLGLTWGFLGSWWGGFLMGGSVAFTATVGNRPRLTWKDLCTPLIMVLLSIGTITLLTGISVWINGRTVEVTLGGSWARVIPTENQLPFLIVACAHFSTYVMAVVCTIVLCCWIGWKRHHLSRIRTE